MGNLKTTLKVGRASAEVSLMKADGKPPDAQHEVRRVPVETIDPKPDGPMPTGELGLDLGFAPFDEGPVVQPQKSPSHLPAASDPFSTGASMPVTLDSPEVHSSQPVQTTVVEERIEWGVWHADSWVDLTDKLKKIDEDNKLDGMNIEATMTLSNVPRDLVRDEHYVLPRDPHSHKFVAMVYKGLKATGQAAVVRWTKRTNQALGVVVPRGTAAKPYLVVLELAWEENVREVPSSAFLDLDLVNDRQLASATTAMTKMGRPASYIRALRDERIAQRIALLDAARNGKVWALAEQEQDPSLQQLGDLLSAVK